VLFEKGRIADQTIKLVVLLLCEILDRAVMQEQMGGIGAAFKIVPRLHTGGWV